ncbi:hypothetical protein [Haliangium sp.]
MIADFVDSGRTREFLRYKLALLGGFSAVQMFKSAKARIED